jgi:hypothetical protein
MGAPANDPYAYLKDHSTHPGGERQQRRDRLCGELVHPSAKPTDAQLILYPDRVTAMDQVAAFSQDSPGESFHKQGDPVGLLWGGVSLCGLRFEAFPTSPRRRCGARV